MDLRQVCKENYPQGYAFGGMGLFEVDCYNLTDGGSNYPGKDKGIWYDKDSRILNGIVAKKKNSNNVAILKDTADLDRLFFYTYTVKNVPRFSLYYNRNMFCDREYRYNISELPDNCFKYHYVRSFAGLTNYDAPILLVNTGNGKNLYNFIVELLNELDRRYKKAGYPLSVVLRYSDGRTVEDTSNAPLGEKVMSFRADTENSMCEVYLKAGNTMQFIISQYKRQFYSQPIAYYNTDIERKLKDTFVPIKVHTRTVGRETGRTRENGSERTYEPWTGGYFNQPVWEPILYEARINDLDKLCKGTEELTENLCKIIPKYYVAVAEV
jgi:hypothetical protein